MVATSSQRNPSWSGPVIRQLFLLNFNFGLTSILLWPSSEKCSTAASWCCTFISVQRGRTASCTACSCSCPCWLFLLISRGLWSTKTVSSCLEICLPHLDLPELVFASAIFGWLWYSFVHLLTLLSFPWPWEAATLLVFPEKRHRNGGPLQKVRNVNIINTTGTTGWICTQVVHLRSFVFCPQIPWHKLPWTSSSGKWK